VNGTRKQKQKTEDTNKFTLFAFKKLQPHLQNVSFMMLFRWGNRSPPYSPDLVPTGSRSGEYGELLSVSPPEEHHERRTFSDVAAIKERVTAVLRSIPVEAFADSFQKLYEYCQQCVVKDGDYFEG
jgi:hypothetical protein